MQATPLRLNGHITSKSAAGEKGILGGEKRTKGRMPQDSTLTEKREQKGQLHKIQLRRRKENKRDKATRFNL